MTVTDEQRSMIATAFVAAFDPFNYDHKTRSLCCASDATEACARIVGKRKAEGLRTFFYGCLGCWGSSDPESHDRFEQLCLDKISELETL